MEQLLYLRHLNLKTLPVALLPLQHMEVLLIPELTRFVVLGTHILSNFNNLRDTTLHKSMFGRAFTAFYYAHSPPIARYLKSRPWARLFVRIGLFPIVFLLENTGYSMAKEDKTKQSQGLVTAILMALALLVFSCIVALLYSS